MKCSPRRIIFDATRLEDIKEAITKVDIRSLINESVIVRAPIKGIAKGAARKKARQKRKGRQKGKGSRKGSAYARLPKKARWIGTIRAQRALLATLRNNEVITTNQYRELYAKSKGGFFRSRRHIKLYIEEHGLVKK